MKVTYGVGGPFVTELKRAKNRMLMLTNMLLFFSIINVKSLATKTTVKQWLIAGSANSNVVHLRYLALLP